ncbi:hypothetical protein [Flavobacterium gilvum]|uniref:Uncharacterized protein n=1 Tax=Flavobacterium gilvum TaxID=1492737 RepID=A0AAC9I868_9FLAO|nr:hypothetical protein [Flavobacterium gilvum]AOW10718.1 hypothetical protein EM308_15125 [Flavobacterium gilvum]KFC60289.1 hypothetical protein FEM08_08960 [Flavobacterium gilvum]
MNKIKITITSLLISFIMQAQEKSEAENFIIDFFKKREKDKVTYYTDKIWPFNLEGIKDALKKTTLQIRDTRFAKDIDEMPISIVFTNKEMDYVYNEIEKNNKEGWAKGKLKDVEFIASENRDKYGTAIYSFSKPVFLRNNTICIFYYDGNEMGTLRTFMKINSEWKYYSMFFQWVN